MNHKDTMLISSDGETSLQGPINRPPPRIQTIRRGRNGSHQPQGSEEGSKRTRREPRRGGIVSHLQHLCQEQADGQKSNDRGI
jgi:hypothetical protein